MKAAVALFPQGVPDRQGQCRESEVEIKNHQTIKALTIDRETNLPELLKQRDALREALKRIIAGDSIGRVGVTLICRAKDALALCDKAEDAPQVISTHIRWNEKGEAEVIETTMDKDGKIHPAVKK